VHGKDKLTGKCFEHHRQRIEDRILELAEYFSVSVHAYAVAEARAMELKQCWSVNNA
jgi:hypothetical protein